MQVHNATYFNRYPTLWRRIVKESPSTILSYGCSMGEEVITASAYCPNCSSLIGYDTNAVMIQLAKARFKDESWFTND